MSEDGSVEVFAERRVMPVLALVKLALGGLLLGATLVALVLGRGEGQALWPILAAAVLLLGFGVKDLRFAVDRRVQVRLSPQGLWLRASDPVVVPWAALAKVEYLPNAAGADMMRFHLKPDAELALDFNPLALQGRFQLAPGGARFLQVDVSPLQDGRVLILGAVAAFAPDLPLRRG